MKCTWSRICHLKFYVIFFVCPPSLLVPELTIMLRGESCLVLFGCSFVHVVIVLKMKVRANKAFEQQHGTNHERLRIVTMS